ncbi:MAG: polyprenol monophosphomannose synthase [Chloroflexi bacterium]|nr:polyprenol monophosphomannose synthase [Chloroflexota bacterium]
MVLPTTGSTASQRGLNITDAPREQLAEVPLVAVVVPTYNEAENLPVLIQQLGELNIARMGFVIVDDKSPDGTGKIADRLASEFDGYFQVLHRPRKLGLGSAYVAGFKLALDAGAEFIIEMDADLSHPTDQVPELLNKLREFDVVVGTRYSPGGDVDPSWNLGRRLLSRLGNVGIRTLVGVHVSDATSGFKAFRRSALEKVDLNDFQTTGFAFQAEMTLACQRAGLEIGEHPYTFGTRSAGQSKMSAGIVYEAIVRLLPLRFRR